MLAWASGCGRVCETNYSPFLVPWHTAVKCKAWREAGLGCIAPNRDGGTERHLAARIVVWFDRLFLAKKRARNPPSAVKSGHPQVEPADSTVGIFKCDHSVPDPQKNGTNRTPLKTREKLFRAHFPLSKKVIEVYYSIDPAGGGSQDKRNNHT